MILKLKEKIAPAEYIEVLQGCLFCLVKKPSVKITCDLSRKTG